MTYSSRTSSFLLLILSLLALGCGERYVAERETAAPVARPEAPAQPKPAPRAVAEGTEFDFGNVPTGTAGSHVFRLRNEGNAPLHVKVLGTSCRCTVADVATDEIPPGKEGAIEVSWDTAETPGILFAQTASIRTNDPDHQTLEFYVHGALIAECAADADQVDFGEFGRGEGRTAEILVYSQLWESLEIKDVQCTNADVAVRTLPPDPERLAAHKGKCGQTVQVTLAGSHPKGSVGGTVKLEVSGVHDGQPEQRTLALPIVGRSRVGLTISGPKWNKSGLEFGRIRQSFGAKTAFIVKAYGEDTIDVESVTVEPQWIRVTHEPVRPNGKDVGLARVIVEIPEDAPLCNHMTPRCAELRIRIKDLPEVVAQLEFAVTE